MTALSEAGLLEHYRPWLRTVARSMTNLDRVDDLAQEGWIALWKEIPRAQAGPAPADWWLKHVATRRMNEVAFRRWRTPQALQDIPAGVGQHHAADEFEHEPDWLNLIERMMPGLWVNLPTVELAYHRGEILAALNRLSPREREYVYMRFWGQAKNAEMVKHFGYRPSTLWINARAKLAADLAHLRERELVGHASE